MNSTMVRAIESFLFVLISAFLSQLIVTGQPINLTETDSQSRILTALLAAFGIAFRQYAATHDTAVTRTTTTTVVPNTPTQVAATPIPAPAPAVPVDAAGPSDE